MDFSLTGCQKSCSHPMTPQFLSLCSHRMPQPIGARALHPYPFQIWLPPPRGYFGIVVFFYFNCFFNLYFKYVLVIIYATFHRRRHQGMLPPGPWGTFAPSNDLPWRRPWLDLIGRCQTYLYIIIWHDAWL